MANMCEKNKVTVVGGGPVRNSYYLCFAFVLFS